LYTFLAMLFTLLTPLAGNYTKEFGTLLF